MVIKSNLNVIDYVSLVNGIISEFFDSETGEYTPHIGRLNAMRLFYNDCVIESKFDLPHDFKDALKMDVLVEDEEFINEFNKAVKGDGTIRLDFANAYADALEAVNAKKNSFGNAVNIIRKALEKVSESISSVVTDESLEKLTKISDSVNLGNLSIDSFVKAYSNYLEESPSKE